MLEKILWRIFKIMIPLFILELIIFFITTANMENLGLWKPIIQITAFIIIIEILAMVMWGLYLILDGEKPRTN